MRAALAANTDHQGLLIVDAAHQAIGAFGEQSIRGAFEEQERRPRFELRIATQQLGIARFELAEMFLLLQRKVLEHFSTAGVFRHPRCTRVEIETAAFGRNRYAQRIPRKHEIGVTAFEARRAPRATFLARAIDLDDALRGAEISGRGDFLDEPLNIGAQKLERPMTGLANEMEMPRLTVRVLEAESAFTEIDFASDASVHHPLQSAVDGGAADAVVLFAYQIDEIVSAEMTFLTQEDVDNLLPLAGALAARRRQPAEIREGTHEGP